MSFPDPNPNQFYKLTLKEAITHYWYGMINASGLLYYAVKIYRRNGHAFKISNIPEFCEKLGITKRKFYKAKADLISTGFLEEEIYGAIGLKSVPLYDDRSITNDDRSITNDDRSITNDDRSITTTVEKLPNNKASSDPPDIPQILNKSLSEEDELTVESTKVVGEENKEGERENFSVFEEEVLEEEVETKIEVEQDLNSSASLSKKEQPQIKPKNLSSRSKGFACSIKKHINTTNSLIPKTARKLIKLGFSREKIEEFQQFAQNKAKKMSYEVQILDLWVSKHLESILAEFYDYQNSQAIKKTDEDKKARQLRVVQEQQQKAEEFEKAYQQHLIENNLPDEMLNRARFKQNYLNNRANN